MENLSAFFCSKLFSSFGFLLVLVGCNEMMTEMDRAGPGLPEVITVSITEIQGESALGNGAVISAGAYPVIERGICWNTSGNPTLEDWSSASGQGVGEFSNVPIDGIDPNVIYYVRAYATNDSGTSYGEEIRFDSGFAVGTLVSGGLVYLNDGEGGGWVVEATDSQLDLVWSSVADVEVGGTCESMGCGPANTELITSQPGHENSPAQRCENLVLSGYDDWYLPSLGTVKALYFWMHSNGIGGFKYAKYWTSTEVDNLNAWVMNFDGNGAQALTKNTRLHWRCVRKF